MPDFTKLGSKPWCGCCSNEQIFRAAEEIIDHVAQKYYDKPMCIGSLRLSVGVAEMMLVHVVGGKMAHESRKEDPILAVLPFVASRALAMTILADESTTVSGELDAFMNAHYLDWEKQMLKKLISIQEVNKADAAFAAQKDT